MRNWEEFREWRRLFPRSFVEHRFSRGRYLKRVSWMHPSSLRTPGKAGPTRPPGDASTWRRVHLETRPPGDGAAAPLNGAAVPFPPGHSLPFTFVPASPGTSSAGRTIWDDLTADGSVSQRGRRRGPAPRNCSWPRPPLGCAFSSGVWISKYLPTTNWQYNRPLDFFLLKLYFFVCTSYIF